MAYSRNALEQLSRADLQKLCKDYGVKANLKSEAIIDLILDANGSKPSTSRPRAVSTRISSLRIRGSSATHDASPDNNDDNQELEEQSQGSEAVAEDPRPRVTSIRVTRTKKAKDLQTRLGVGRPKLAGGSGARAVTKVISTGKGKRSKSSRSLKKPVEDTIAEEPEPETLMEQPKADVPQPDAAEMDNPDPEPPGKPDTPMATLTEIDKHVAEALRPLHEQMKLLRDQVEQMQALRSEVDNLKKKAAAAESLQQTVESLTTEVTSLRDKAARIPELDAELSQLKKTLSIQGTRTPGDSSLALPTTPHFTSTPLIRNPVHAARVGAFDLEDSFSSNRPLDISSIRVHPGFAPSTLGKRVRDPTESDMTGLFEGHEDEVPEEQQARVIARSPKKRARTEDYELRTPTNENDEDEALAAASTSPPRPAFTIFTDREEEDPPPPTAHLPNFYGPASPTGSRRSRPPTAATSSAQGSENQPQAYNFSFMPPTPGGPFLGSNYPFLEPPKSPSPQHQSSGSGSSTAVDSGRTDVFQTFGMPAPGRPKSRIASTGLYVNPVALTKPPDAMGGLEASAQPMKLTMYGTELEADTRFGDFGTEGVASGFWVGGRI